MYGPRATQVSRLVAELPALGWHPTVVCLAPRRGGPHWFDGAASEPPDGAEYLRVPSPEEWWVVRAARRFVSPLRDRPDSARVWVAGAVRAAATVARSHPVTGLITFGQPWSDHLVGLRVQQATGLPWVAHFSDPWAASPYATPRQQAIWRPMEAQTIRRATAIVFVTAETADLTMATYPREWRAKVSVVPHGFDPRRRPPIPARPSVGRRMRFVYTGRFYSGRRTPVPLLRAIAAVARDDAVANAIEVLLVGPHVEEFRRDAELLGVDGAVTFKGPVASAEAAAEAAAADVLLVIDAPSGTPSVFLPSKLIDYLPLRKPILGLTPPRGASASLLARLGFPIVPPDDVDAIAAALRGLIGQWRAGTLQVGAEFDRIAAEFDIRCTARQLSDVLARACG